MERRLLRMNEAAEVCAVSRSKMYLLAQRGEVPVVRVGRTLRVPVAALEAWIAANTHGAA